MTAQQTVAMRKVPSTTQRTVRRRVSRLDLLPAVRQAVDSFFDFTHRASDAKALWSETATVWLGRTTYLHWALDDEDIDIPWLVARTRNTPEDANKLRETVKSELDAYWSVCLSSLPRTSTCGWLPLP